MSIETPCLPTGRRHAKALVGVSMVLYLLVCSSCKKDAATNTPSQQITLTGPTVFIPVGILRSPQGIATDETGNVWVADTRNNRIRRFSQSAVQNDSVTVIQPSSIAIDKRTGDLLIVENRTTVSRYLIRTKTWIASYPLSPFVGDASSVFDVETRRSSQVSPAMHELGDIDSSPMGDIYVSAKGSPANFIVRILSGNVSVVAASFEDSSRTRPRLLAVDRFGTVFTTFNFSRGPSLTTGLYAITPGNITQSHALGEPFVSGGAAGATIDAVDYLYIADASTQEVIIVSTATERTVGRYLVPDANGFSMVPRDISVASDGSVYVVVNDRLGTDAGAVLRYTRTTR